MRAAVGPCPPPLLAPGELRPLPPRRPRLFALDLGDPDDACAELQRSLSDALEAGRFYKPEQRPFWAHVTMARVKRDRRAQALPPGPPPVRAFRARQVTLYRSVLGPRGARYEPLERARLG